jgi:hypothetical protein
MQRLKVLITVKTYPIPSSMYDEFVCTAGVTETGDFVRLYPINFRDLPFSQQYRKYQWIEVCASKHRKDPRKESYRPACQTLAMVGQPIKSKPHGDWSDRARYALRKKAQSIEDLYDRQDADQTSLGVFRPKEVHDLVVTEDEAEWKPAFLEALKQHRLWDDRKVTREPPRKVPFKFHYHFECEDSRCKGSHSMSLRDWEVGALYWKLMDAGATPCEAAEKVRHKFLYELCGRENDTHFFVGTVLEHPRKWLVLGLFYPKIETVNSPKGVQLQLFDDKSSR